MSWADDYFNLVEEDKKKKKKRQEEAPETFETSPYSAMGRLAAKASTSQSEEDEKRSSAKQSEEEEKGLGERLLDAASNWIPAVKVGKGVYDFVQSARNGELDFFQKGPFEDGFEWSDIPKAIAGTTGDVAMEAAAGFGGALEGINDLILHGSAWIAENNGYTNDAKRLREQAEVDVIGDVMLGEARDAVDNWSVLGRTSKGAAQGLGQIGLILGTGGAGSAAGLGSTGVSLLTTGTTFASSAGAGINEAYLGGATDDEAWKYGLSVGAIDAGTELLFGGLGKTVSALGLSKGISSLDDIFAKKLSSQIANQTAKNMVEFGVKASAEGFEEVLAGIGTAISKKLTYMSEEELLQLVKDENLREQFVVGSVISGLAQGGDVIDANRTGSDFVTGLTGNEQKVLDKVYDDAIKEAEQGGKKLTSKEKAEIYDRVAEDLAKGYISTDTIEEVLGGDTYKAYKESLDSDNALKEQQKTLQDEFNSLNKLKQGEMTGEQIDRREELRQELKDIQAKIDDPKTVGQRNYLKAQLQNNVYKMSKGDRLVESYFEQVRSKQKFEVDLSKYKGKAREVMQQVMDSGLADNSRATHEFWDMAAKIAENRDTKVSIADQAQIIEMLKKEHEAKGKTFDASKFDGKIIDGFWSENGIVLNAESKRARSFVIGHEITHSLEKSKHYAALQKLLFNYNQAEYKSRFDSRKAQYQGIYTDEEYKAKIDKEVTADMVGDFVFSDYDFVKHLATQNQNVFQKIWSEIKHLAKIATAGSKEARELEKVKREFERAWNETKGQKNTADGGVKMSIETTPDGKKYVRADRQVIFGNDPDSWSVQVEDYINGKIRRGENISLVAEDGDILVLTADTAGKIASNKTSHGTTMADEKFYVKANAGVHIDELAQVSVNDKPNKKPKTDRDARHGSFAEGGWTYRTAFFHDFDGKYYRLKISAAKGPDGNVVYNIGDIEERSFPKVTGSSAKGGALNGKASSGDSVAQNGENVKYSLSDSDGKKLTKEQQDYFKDSKMRDENGNLKVMYHGSQGAGFHVFDPSMSDDGTSLFFVDRNDVAASYSGTTETYEARTIRTAEDMNNFLAEIGYDQYEAVEKDGKFELLENGDHVAWSDTAQGIYEEFCWYEGVGDGDANYKVYLNLVNPLEVDGQGRPWNKIDAEFSQEVYDRYQSLTPEEKAALTDLAEWEDFRIFNSEIQEARGDALESAYAKMGEDCNIYDLFSVAADNFSEEAMRENARKYLKTRDFAQRAKEQGHDGVIFKNIIDNGGYSNGDEGASTVAIAFDSNQVKSVANEKPTGDADIRYSLSDTEGRQLSKEQADYFKDSTVRDENGSIKVMYHGTPNGDFTVFKDGTYFTDNKEYADKYQNPGASSLGVKKSASNPKTYQVYLDIKKPFDINDAEARRVYIEDYIKGGNAIGINPYLSDAEYAKIKTIDWTEGEDLREFLIDNGYDYDGLVLDEGATGGYGDEIKSRGTSYVVFNPEQVKDIDNRNPTADPDIRFSLSEAVEETKELMAIHNLSEEKLIKSLRLGGLPMPSVAIAKAKDGHGEFGEISLILQKDAIDPQTSSRNKLYSGDAWTPTYPAVEYKPNINVLWEIDDKISALVPKNVQSALGNLMFDTSNARDYLNRYSGNMVEAYKKNDAMKYAYLKDTGSDISLPTKEEDLYLYGGHSNAAVRYFSGKLVNGLQTVELYRNTNSRELLQDKALTEAVADAQNFDVLRTLEPGSDEYLEYERNPVFRADEVSLRDILNFLDASRKLFTNGIQQTVDRKAAKELIGDSVDQTAYESWLEKLFSGVVEKEGIRNNKDYYTPSGNPRSFEALHYEHNLENVIKAMREKGEKGIGNGFGGASIFGASTTEFSSIKEMKQASDRLQTMSYDEYQEMRKGFTDRFLDIAMSLPNQKNSFSATDSAAEVLTEAVAKYSTRNGIANYLRRELKGWATYSDHAVDDLIELVRDIRNMPTGYFEAKPQRAVGFDEVGVFIIPYNASAKLKQELLNGGYAIAEYDPKVDGDRTRVLNQFEEYKFSLSDAGQTFKSGKGWNAPMSDMRYTPDIAPVSEEVNTKVNTKVKNATRNASDDEMEAVAPVDELFPDEHTPDMDDLMAEARDIMGAIEAYEAVGDTVQAEQLATEYESIMERIGQMQQEEAARVDSLKDAEAPPEVEAPYYEGSKPAKAENPFADRDWHNMGNRKVKAYMYEHPEVKPFFQEMAGILAWDLSDTTKAERWYNDQLHYESGGEKGFGGNKRHTSRQIETMLDDWHMSYADIEKGLTAIIEDNGAENISAAKKIEFMLNDMLRNGYMDFHTGKMVEPNQEYIATLNAMDADAYSKEAFDALMAEAEQYGPVAEEVISKKETTTEAPVAEKYEAIKPKPTKEPRMARATPEEQAQTAKILFGEHQTPKQKSAWKWAKEHIFRHGAVFEDLSLKTGNRELQARFDNIRRAESRAQTFIGKGKGHVKALVDVRKAVEKAGKTEAFNYYLYHLHNVDRMTLEERFKDVPNKAVFGGAVTAEVSRKAAMNLETLNPEFKKWAEDVYSINKHLRQMMVDEGIISQETADLWQTMYPHYVPIIRADYEGLNINVPLDTKRTGVNAPIKKAKGGNSDFYNVFDTMGSRIEQTYKAISKNRFGVELKNTLGTAFESEKADIDSVLESMDAHEELLQEGKNGESPTFTVFENGERVKFAITKDMYDAMKPSQFTYTNETLKKVNNVRRDILTTFSPTFALTNPIKDVQDILLNSQHPAKTYVAIPEAIKSVIAKDHWYQERMENGGDQDTYFDGQKKTFKTEKSQLSKIVGFPFEKIRQANEVIEQVPRMAEYIASRKMGRSVDVSMLDAARVTTNFGAAGDFTNMLNRNGFTFLGASVEGFNQQVRNVREAKAEGAKGWAKLAGKYLAAGLPALLLNHMLWDDDEEYEELSDYVKQNYYVVAKTEDGKFVRIPKGRAVSVIQDAFRQMENMITGNDETDLSAFAQLVVNNLAPNNPLENNIIAPLYQAYSNKTWYGDDLVPTRLQDMPAAEQFDETTDSLSKWLGEATNTSPYKWNYILDQYSGGVGDLLLPYLTPEADGGGFGAALRDKFAVDPVLKNENVSNFYDKMDELSVNANSMYATDEDVLMSKYMSSVNSELSKLYQQKREIQNDSYYTDDEKYELVREIQQEIVDLTRNSLNTYNKVTIQGDYARVGDRHYRRNDNGEWQKLTDKQVDKMEDVTSDLGIHPSEYWGNKSEYDFAYEYPEKYAVAKSLGGYESYKTYTSELYDIKADKDENGKSITGSRKEKVIDYVNSLDIDYGMRLIIFKSEYNADDTYNYEILDYLNSREDLSYEDIETILKELGFNVDSEGNVTWD